MRKQQKSTVEIDRTSLQWIFTAFCLLLSGCAVPRRVTQHEGNGVIRATVSTAMVADIVRNVGGSRVEATTLMGAGVDPHLYKASLSDVRKLANAEIVFYNGLHLEGKLGEVLSKLQTSRPVVAVSETIPKSELRTPPEFEGSPDPHVWFDVQLWMRATEATRDELVKFDPAGKADYERNATRYLAQLKSVDEYARKQIATIPRGRRVLVTAHDAFGYFGRAYDIEVVGLQGISTASEYGLGDVQRLVQLLVKRNVKAVFVESSIPRRAIEAVAQGCAARGHNVVIGGELYADAMGAPNTPEGTYIGMVKANVDTVVKALK
ncbi:MAG TPA: zinc ABC transporter substrate-binding protein [Abditibacteriaceae bacterium]|jgi:manganese/zinc/iron transport system substrate-binding protein